MNYRIIPVTSLQQNCSLIWCENTGKATLIDPGGDVDRLMQAIAEQGVHLTQILLTHGHIDHVGGAREMADYKGVPIVGPQCEDAFLFEALPAQAEHFGFAPLKVFMPDHWLVDGQVVDIGDVQLSVLHCPGHTPGHVAFYHRDSQTAFVGDILFHGSIGRTDFPRGDHQALIHSITEKLFPLGDAVRFVPGHGPLSSFGAERTGNPFLS